MVDYCTFDELELIAAVITIPKDPIPETECFEHIGNGVRTDASMARIYDREHAELIGEHVAEKIAHRMRRKENRRHNLTPKQRKEQEELRNCNLYYGPMMDGTWMHIREGRVRSAEKSARADFELEQRNISEEEAEMYHVMISIEESIKSRDRVVGILNRIAERAKRTAEELVAMPDPVDVQTMEDYDDKVQAAYDEFTRW